MGDEFLLGEIERIEESAHRRSRHHAAIPVSATARTVLNVIRAYAGAKLPSTGRPLHSGE
ncbi:hypothetical protein DIE23_11980 [Burkholderia sp. Bp9143]|nr:hypothetical protein DIE23_11980 [Burkholderia sp. Bp9143]